ncbi:UDP-glucuronosyltransferase 2C1-like [Montipora foliosa]|uniref:UDP-glucuronosyltransferase 2C1-like n=1 Tax=Montipora foliosa TaxID=591990 RepID=UPI0035F1FF09
MTAIFCGLVISFMTMNPIYFALSARIVGFSAMSSGSHYLLIRTVMEELATRGHEVVMMVGSDHTHSRSTEKIPHKVYQVPFKRGYIKDVVSHAAMEKNMFQLFRKISEYFQTSCDSLLKSKELLEDLRNFDLVVYERGAICGVFVGELFQIPKVSILTGIPRPGSSFKVPSPVSYVPMLMTGFTDKMSFLQRVANLGAYFALNLMSEFMIRFYAVPLKTKYNITPEIGIYEALSNDELSIMSGDFALDYPQPLLPGQILVGPITIKKPKPLPAELESYVNSSGIDGFIIVSFGSYAETLASKDRIDTMAAAFGKLKQKVLWKLKNYIPQALSPNIRVMDWLPQNDLLAHKKVKAFVSHAGHNSLYESGYHGVPMVGIPLYADQFSNAKKAEDFGFALSVNLKTVNSEQLAGIIKQVLNDPRFKNSAMRISKLMQDKPRLPVETAADWIEYVLRHGGARHLRAQVFNIPWYQYYLLDVMAFLVTVVTLIVTMIVLTCRCFCHLCSKRNGPKSKKE